MERQKDVGSLGPPWPERGPLPPPAPDTTPQALPHAGNRECSPTYKVNRAPWRTLQKKRLGLYLTGTWCCSPRGCRGVREPTTLVSAWPYQDCATLSRRPGLACEVRASPAKAASTALGFTQRNPTCCPAVQGVLGTQLPTGGPGCPLGPGGPWRKRRTMRPWSKASHPPTQPGPPPADLRPGHDGGPGAD